jgi:hypothetical protein
VPGLDGPDDGVQHQRDPGERLYRPVVQEQREPPTLLLLGGHQLVGEPGMLSREPLHLLVRLALPSALAEEQQSSERTRGRNRGHEPCEGKRCRVDGEPEQAEGGACHDRPDEQDGSSR